MDHWCPNFEDHQENQYGRDHSFQYFQRNRDLRALEKQVIHVSDLGQKRIGLSSYKQTEHDFINTLRY